MSDGPHDGTELTVEYETGTARRAIAFREATDGDHPYEREQWVYGAEGWRVVGSEPCEQFELEV